MARVSCNEPQFYYVIWCVLYRNSCINVLLIFIKISHPKFVSTSYDIDGAETWDLVCCMKVNNEVKVNLREAEVKRRGDSRCVVC